MNFFLRCLQAAEPHLLQFEQNASKLCITFAEDELCKLGDAIAGALSRRAATPAAAPPATTAPAPAPAPAEAPPTPSA